MNQKVDNYACRSDRTEQKRDWKLSIHRGATPSIFFTPTTDWIDKNDSSQSRSEFGQGWRATKKVRSGCKRVMQELECETCFSIRIDFKRKIPTVCWRCYDFQN